MAAMSSAMDMVSTDFARVTALALTSSHLSSASTSEELVPLVELQTPRVLARDLCAPEDVPSFRASLKDGYALAALSVANGFQESEESEESGPGFVELRVVEEVRAGVAVDGIGRVGALEAAYITTGAPVPEGCDAIVMVEDTERIGDRVRIKRAVSAGADIRGVGSDLKQGEMVLRKGAVIGPAELGLLATTGVSEVPVVPLPRIAVMSTGDEVVEPDVSAFERGQVRDSNRVMLIALAKQAGVGAVRDAGIVTDSKEDLRTRLHSIVAEGVQILITSGGVSMGDRDYIKPLLKEYGDIHFGRVCMKPGKPLTFATLTVDGKPLVVFGLPGNPVSSAVTFNLFVEPVLRHIMGMPSEYSRVNAKLTRTIMLDHTRPEYHRATLHWQMPQAPGQSGEWWAESTGRQASSRLASMRNANALLELPQCKRQGESLAAGTLVSAIVIGDLRVNPSASAPQSDKEKSRGLPLVHLDKKVVVQRIRIGIVTVSDRATQGIYEDLSGPAIREFMTKAIQGRWDPVVRIIPDEQPLIEETLRELCDVEDCCLVVTSGGTGPSKRDVTPEATFAVCDKVYHGFGELMRAESLKYVPTAILSRQTAGSRASSLIVNLPGKPKSIAECLNAVFPAIPYCIDLLEGPRIEPNSEFIQCFRPKPKP